MQSHSLGGQLLFTLYVVRSFVFCALIREVYGLLSTLGDIEVYNLKVYFHKQALTLAFLSFLYFCMNFVQVQKVYP